MFSHEQISKSIAKEQPSSFSEVPNSQEATDYARVDFLSKLPPNQLANVLRLQCSSYSDAIVSESIVESEIDKDERLCSPTDFADANEKNILPVDDSEDLEDTVESLKSLNVMSSSQPSTVSPATRSLRKRQEIQMKPFTLESAKYRSLMKRAAYDTVALLERQPQAGLPMKIARREKYHSDPDDDYTQDVSSPEPIQRDGLAAPTTLPYSYRPTKPSGAHSVTRVYSRKKKSKRKSKAPARPSSDESSFLDIFDYDFNHSFDTSARRQSDDNSTVIKESSKYKKTMEHLFSGIFSDDDGATSSSLGNRPRKDHHRDPTGRRRTSLGSTSDGEVNSPSLAPRHSKRKRILIEESEDESSDTDNTSLVEEQNDAFALRNYETENKSRHNKHDAAFIVSEQDYEQQQRHRRVTLDELQQRKKVLKGILPLSFANVFKKQLIEEKLHRIDQRTLKKTHSTSSVMDARREPLSRTCSNIPKPARSTVGEALRASSNIFDEHETAPQGSFKENTRALLDAIHDDGLVSLSSFERTARLSPHVTNEVVQITSHIFRKPMQDSRYFTKDIFWMDSVHNLPKVKTLFWKAFQCLVKCRVDQRGMHNIAKEAQIPRTLHEAGLIEQCSDALAVISIFLQKWVGHHDIQLIVDTIKGEGSILCARALSLADVKELCKYPVTRNTKLPCKWNLVTIILLYTLDWANRLQSVDSAETPPEWMTEACAKRLIRLLFWLGPHQIITRTTYQSSHVLPEDMIVTEAWVTLIQIMEKKNKTFVWDTLTDLLGQNERRHGPISSKGTLTQRWTVAFQSLQHFRFDCTL